MGTLLLRSLIIIFGSTFTAFALVNAASSSASGLVSGYGSWWRDVVTLKVPSSLWDGVLVTAQLAVVSVVAGALIGALLASITRNSTAERVVRSALTPITGLVAPAIVLSVGYWLGDQLGLLSDQTFAGFLDSPADGVRAVLFPAIVLALAVAPGLIVAFRGQSPALAEIGWASAAAPLAGRATTHNQWTLGFPTGPFLLALAVVETIAVPTGLFAQFVDALAPVDAPILLGVVLIVALGGAILSLIRDLFGSRFAPDDTRRLGGTRPRQEGRAGAIAFSVGMVGLAGFVIAALIAVNLRIPESDTALSGPLSDGFLFGSDAAGRDLLSLAVAATGPVLQRALIPAVVASVFGTALALGIRTLGRRADQIIESFSDLLWWPAPLIGLLSVRAFGHGDETLLLIAAMLVPFAMRLARREIVGFNAGIGRRFGGMVALVAAAAFAIDTTIKFLRPPSRVDTGWGQQMAAGADVLGQSVWPALVAGVATLLFSTVLHLVGSYLISSGWAAWLASPEAVIGAADLEAEEIAAAEAAKPKPVVERPALTQGSGAEVDQLDESEQEPTLEVPAVSPHAAVSEYDAATPAPEAVIDLTDADVATDETVALPTEAAPMYAAVGAADIPQSDGQSVWSALETDGHPFSNWADDSSNEQSLPQPQPMVTVPPTIHENASEHPPPPPPPPTAEFIAPPPPPQ